jgi:hypothetical protein
MKTYLSSKNVVVVIVVVKVTSENETKFKDKNDLNDVVKRYEVKCD